MTDSTPTPSSLVIEGASEDVEKTPHPVQDNTRSPSDTEETALRVTDGTVYLKGLQLHSVTVAVALAIFLTNLEIPIVTTALISITNDLQGFNNVNWIITSYLLGYVGVVILWAKFSDHFGRKLSILASLAIFTVFSAACGGSQTMTQLIVFRAFQGLGGGGNFALGTIFLVELVPPEKYPLYTTIMSVILSMSLLLGPILGGVISEHSTWRWIFFLNIPAGSLAIVLAFLFIPLNFPYQGQPAYENRRWRTLFSKAEFKNIDFLGAGLLLIATLFLVSAIQEGGVDYAWKSGFEISFLIIAGIGWISFLLWERKITLFSKTTEPVFPWRLIKSRVWMGMIGNAFFLGGPWFVTVFQLPQRFQVVNDVSPLQAGIRLVPFTLACPLGSIISAVAAGKYKVPPIYMVIFASVMQIIGFSLISTLPTTAHTRAAEYGYQIIAGFGVGINISLLIMMTPFCVEARDKSVALGSVTQFRIMGGLIGLAVVSAVSRNTVSSDLKRFLTEDQIKLILQSTGSINLFTPSLQQEIRNVFANGYNLQFKILLGFSAAQIPSSLLMWQKKQILL
ncbi:MFS thioclapurine efflux transporter tcpA [Lachnellula suecica]|uniref:MFS thioclapurine efflux transporter tcpA n=1 Tax=Lachnellula suecica TaxID=602035 RepID=A0A8T9C413_9HELO|nr:MFS thioclapurine efflux transporter tcpA [Lachnellula suecica]